MSLEERRGLRREVLRLCGAEGELIDELLRYTQEPVEAVHGFEGLCFPLPDEPHVAQWIGYETDARQRGIFEALSERFVQLRFPIRAGISRDPAYRAATRKGRFEQADAFVPGLALERAGDLELVILPTMAGRIPVLTAAARADFVALVRAFTERNEPAAVPESMGACIVTGLNNWDRIRSHRAAWERAQAGFVSEQAWADEFRRLKARKELYQDRFILLSRGPYSGVGARDIGMDENDWLRLSLVIRREHELTHHFTFRVFGFMQNHLLDELIADAVGLARAVGRYRADWALRFLGLESYPDYRPGGRLEAYRGRPALSDEGFRVLRSLAFRSARNLEEAFDERAELIGDLGGLARLTFALATLSLEELASAQMPALVGQRLSKGAGP